MEITLKNKSGPKISSWIISTILLNSIIQIELKKNSNLSLPMTEISKSAGISGTRDFDWWFFNEAVVLDTAGRYSIPIDEDNDVQFNLFMERNIVAQSILTFLKVRSAEMFYFPR